MGCSKRCPSRAATPPSATTHTSAMPVSPHATAAATPSPQRRLPSKGGRAAKSCRPLATQARAAIGKTMHALRSPPPVEPPRQCRDLSTVDQGTPHRCRCPPQRPPSTPHRPLLHPNQRWSRPLTARLQPLSPLLQHRLGLWPQRQPPGSSSERSHGSSNTFDHNELARNIERHNSSKN